MAIDVNRERAIDLAVSQIEKQFGKGAIMKLGEEALVRGIAVVSTGTPSMANRPSAPTRPSYS